MALHQDRVGHGSQPNRPATEVEGRRLGALLRRASTAWFVAGLLALAVIGLAAALASTGTSTPAGASLPAGRLTPGTSIPGGSRTPGGGGGRFGAFAGDGVVGTVSTVGSGRFSVTDRSGAAVTVLEQSSTTYRTGSSTASVSVVVVGARVAVAGTRSGTTVTATTVVVLPAGGFGSGFGGGPPSG